jgi:hypothetical protein
MQAYHIGGAMAVLALYTKIKDTYGLTDSAILPVRYYPCTRQGVVTCLDR